MKYLLPVLLAAMMAAAAPAMADNDHGRGGGGWHGRGEGRGDGGGRGGWRGGEGNGRGGEGRGGGPQEGRWGGGGGRYAAGPEGGPVYAEPPRGRGPEVYRGEQDDARNGVRGGWKSMGEVVGQLQRRGGRMLDAGLTQGPDGRPAYRVIWASPEGRRIDYLIDAQSGAILQGR